MDVVKVQGIPASFSFQVWILQPKTLINVMTPLKLSNSTTLWRIKNEDMIELGELIRHQKAIYLKYWYD